MLMILNSNLTRFCKLCVFLVQIDVLTILHLWWTNCHGGCAQHNSTSVLLLSFASPHLVSPTTCVFYQEMLDNRRFRNTLASADSFVCVTSDERS